ncbi:2CS histidine protein kinase [Bifidobacterium ramosum]|uniref:2CS histidine protein kinase n=2 Tax=Bifidobacterium ramosum TaxID=1798158 RepID=A0A6L4WZD2_9BIFI|nr:hypothetical protein [Bifidobacterium ramosum]KAB8287695.1 2CS histidine protein kinase [Bifidobacterium ramosum]
MSHPQPSSTPRFTPQFTPPRRTLTIACATVACCVVTETILRWPTANFHVSYLLIPLLALASLPVLALAPEAGAWLVTTLICVGLVSPFPMSYSYLLAMAVAMTIIWREHRWAAALAGLLAVTALLVDRRLLFGLGVTDSVVVSFAYCMFAIVIGLVSRWMADSRRTREQARQRRERERIAAALHDRTTNDLANAIMLVNTDLDRDDLSQSQRDDLLTIRSFIQRAMTGTYQAIDTLDDSDDGTGSCTSADVRRPQTSPSNGIGDPH